MGKPAVFLEFRGAAGIRNAYVRGHDDVRGAGIVSWVVEVQRERWAIVDLPEPDSGRHGGVRFEDSNGGVGIGGTGQPQQRNVIFRGANAGRVVGRLRKWHVASIGEQSGW